MLDIFLIWGSLFRLCWVDDFRILCLRKAKYLLNMTRYRFSKGAIHPRVESTSKLNWNLAAPLNTVEPLCLCFKMKLYILGSCEAFWTGYKIRSSTFKCPFQFGKSFQVHQQCQYSLGFSKASIAQAFVISYSFF